MMGKLTPRERVLIAAGAMGLVVALALAGGLLYAVNSASATMLRWWAGLTTAALPLAGGIGYYLGRVEARGHVAGLTQGIEVVSEAARRTADVRVSTAQRMRQGRNAPAFQQVLMPFPTLPYGGNAGVIMPPQPSGDDEVEV